MKEEKADIRVDPAWRGWCREVLEQVRFRPDHKAIQKELTAHLEDGRADLERLGYPRDLAAKRALQAMGDAKEVGRALDQAHHPFLGWLWRLSRWLVTAVIAVTVLTVVLDIRVGTVVSKTVEQLRMPEPPASAVELDLGHYTVWYDPNLAEDPEAGDSAGIRIWIKEDWPWGDLRSDWRQTWAGELELAGEQGVIEAQDCYLGAVETGWNRVMYTLYVDLDSTPQWLEARYPHGENGWVLRAERGTE